MIYFCPNLTPKGNLGGGFLVWSYLGKVNLCPLFYFRPWTSESLCTSTRVPLPDIWQFSGTPHLSFWSSLHLSFPLFLWVIAVLLCVMYVVFTVRVCNFGCCASRFIIRLPRPDMAGKQLLLLSPVNQNSWIYNHTVVRLSVSLPLLRFLYSPCIYSFCLHLSFSCLFLCFVCQSLRLSACPPVTYQSLILLTSDLHRFSPSYGLLPSLLCIND